MRTGGPQGGYQPRSWAGRGPAGTAGGLPVGHHDLDRTVGAVQDEHRRRGQVAVYDTMAVGVADCFADLAQQVELGGEWDALRMVCEPEVEAAELGAQRVDQADAELGLDQISRPQDAVVVEGLDSAELVLGDLPASALVIDRGAGRAHQEPDPRVLLPGHPVVGGPVLPAVALVEGLVVDDPRTGPKNAWSDRSTMNKIMEYMFFGLPVVGYELTENRVSAGPAALFAEPNRERALAGGIAELLDDPARREQMSLAGRERVRSVLAWEHSAPVLLAAYDRLWPVPSGGHVVDLAPRARQVRSRRVSRDAG